MQTSLGKLDNLLVIYFERFIEATLPNASTRDLRVATEGLVRDKAFWQKLLTVSESDRNGVTTKDWAPQLFIVNGLSEILTRQLIPSETLHQERHPVIRHFQWWLMRHWLAQFAVERYEDDFQMVLEFVARVLKPYNVNAGKTFDCVLDGFSDVFKEAMGKPATPDSFNETRQQLIESFQSFQKKIKVFEQRVIDFERQQSSNLSAARKAEALINAVIGGIELPYWAFQFIEESWHRLLHLSILKNNDNEEIIEPIIKNLTLLVESLQLTSPEEVQQAMVSSIADLRANIRELFQSIVMDESELDTFLTQLENHHIAILEGQSIDEDGLSIAPTIPEGEEDDSLDPTIFAQTKIGNWFEYVKEGRLYYCRVIDRDMQHKQIILVNYSGARVDCISFQRLSRLLKDNAINPFSLDSQLDQWSENIAIYIQSQIKVIEQQQSQRQKDALKKQVVERIEASRKQRLQAEKSKREAQQRAEAHKVQEQRQLKVQNYLKLAMTMAPGSTFILHSDGDKLIQFALKLKQSQKLIFVDKRGVKAAEMMEDEFAIAMADGDIELLTSGSTAEQTLEQIVAQQRSQRRDTQSAT